MRHRLPWWLFVILGWVAVYILALDYLYLCLGYLWIRAQARGMIGPAWHLTLLGGALVTLVVCITVGGRTFSAAREHGHGCAFTIAIPLLLLVPALLLVSLWLATSDFYLWRVVFQDWNPFIILLQPLRGVIG